MSLVITYHFLSASACPYPLVLVRFQPSHPVSEPTTRLQIRHLVSLVMLDIRCTPIFARVLKTVYTDSLISLDLVLKMSHRLTTSSTWRSKS